MLNGDVLQDVIKSLEEIYPTIYTTGTPIKDVEETSGAYLPHRVYTHKSKGYIVNPMRYKLDYPNNVFIIVERSACNPCVYIEEYIPLEEFCTNYVGVDGTETKEK